MSHQSIINELPFLSLESVTGVHRQQLRILNADFKQVIQCFLGPQTNTLLSLAFDYSAVSSNACQSAGMPGP